MTICKCCDIITVMRCRPFFLLSSFFIITFLYFNPVPVLQPFSGTDSPEYRWDTVLCISFLFDKKSLGHKPNGALKPFDGTIQTKKRLGYPNRFFVVSTKKHRSESERCLVREMGLEPTRQRHTHLKRACLPIPALSHIF